MVFGLGKQKKTDKAFSSTTASSSLLRPLHQSTTASLSRTSTRPAGSVPWDLDLGKGTAVWQSNVPPLPEGARHWHSSVTLPNGSVVVAGGEVRGSVESATTTVWIWTPQSPSRTWMAGPPLQDRRKDFALVLCGNRLYAIGGFNGLHTTHLDTVEFLDVSLLCGGTHAGQEPRALLSEWTTLPCRLSNARSGCAAVAVFDRYLVVVGGQGYHGGTNTYFDTVDILDTQRNTVQPSGSHMTTARCNFGVALVGNTIFAVGGFDGSNKLNTLECCDIMVDHSSESTPKGASSAKVAVTNPHQGLDLSWWLVVKKLHLSTSRNSFGLATVGHCLIVAGGAGKGAVKSVEVVDTQKGKVWQLPEMRTARWGCTVVALRDCRLAVLGGYEVDSVETLALVKSKTTKAKATLSSRSELGSNIQKQTKLVERDKQSMDSGVVKKGAEAEKQLQGDFEKEVAAQKKKKKVGSKTKKQRPAKEPIRSSNTVAEPHDTQLPFQAERTRLRKMLDGQDRNLCPLSQEYVDHITTPKKLGEGFFGVVYAAHDAVLQKSFAIKKIHPETLQHAHTTDIELARASFQQELATLVKFHHPNIAMLFGFHFQENIRGMQSLVFELAECGSLDYFWTSELGRERLSAEKIRFKIALDTFTAVHFLHQGVDGIESCFHRDIKSANICLTRDLTAKLIDCGLAKLVDEKNMGRLSTSVKGTRGYTCPLYESGELTGYEAACDVFSFGVVMAEIWTGKLQNHSSGSGTRAVNYHRKYVVREDPMEQDLDPSVDVARDVNGGLPAHLLDYVRLAVSCMQEEPQTRPTGGEVLSRLRAVCRACPGPEKQPDASPKVPRQVRCVCRACLIESDCLLSQDGDYLCVTHCWRAVQAGKFVNEKYSKQDDILAQQKELGEELRKEIKLGFSTISEKLESMSVSLARLEAKAIHPIPRLFVVFPRGGRKRGFWKSYKSWLGSLVRQELNLFFVCAHSGEVAASCPIKLFVTREWVKTVGPALVLSLKLLSLAGIAVSGIPFNMSGVVEKALLATGELDEMAQELVGKVLDRSDQDLMDRISSGEMDDQDVKRLNDNSLGLVAERAMSEKGWMDEMVCVRKRGQSVVLWVKQKYANLPKYEPVNI